MSSVPESSPLGKVLAKLPRAKRCGTGWSARCPAHDDSRPSLTIGVGDDGRALVSCKCGCPPEKIVAALGLAMRDLFPERDAPAPRRAGKPTAKVQTFRTASAAVADLERRLGKRSAEWAYRDPAGRTVGLVVRFDPPGGKKEIRPIAKCGGGWRIGAMPGPRPLYALPELAEAARVLVVEGEKCADAARGIGFTATTSAGGSQAAGKTDWTPLAGKEVWLLPDNDRPGREYAEAVAATLRALSPAPRVKIIDLPGLGDGGDIADWIGAHGDAAEPGGMRAELEAIAFAPPAEPEPNDAAPGYRPFPVDALPEPIRGFVADGAKAIGCDPSYLALPLLTALAAAIGNTRRLEMKRGWHVPPILWSVVVGESGTAKTPAFRLALAPVWKRQTRALKKFAEQEKQYAMELSRWEKKMAAWKRDRTAADPPNKPEPPHADRYAVEDTTVEALAPILKTSTRGLLLARDELNGWIGSFDRYAGGKGGTDLANWLSMHNAKTITVDRKTGVPRTIHVPHAAVCVTGGIQPGILRCSLDTAYRAAGLAARLLLACPPRRTKRWTDAGVDPDAEKKLEALFDRLYELQPEVDDEGEPRPVLVNLAPEAKAVWVAYYNAHAVEQADLTGDLSAAWSKLEEYAARLALVLHFARWAAADPNLSIPGKVDSDTMTAAVKLTAWFKREALRVYALLSESDAEGEHRRLVEWVERRGGSTTAREAQQGCRWLKEPGTAEAALELLAKAGLGLWRSASGTARGGRPTRVFTLSTSTKPH